MIKAPKLVQNLYEEQQGEITASFEYRDFYRTGILEKGNPYLGRLKDK